MVAQLFRSKDRRSQWVHPQLGLRLPRSSPRLLDPAAACKKRPSLFEALREQLGLRLEPAKGPVEYYVIDRVNLPSPN
ncbi:MAG TPA: TIGR03435 family protein [Terracidiphilus sp.]|nr:TIGR03435 family protein [Terracidiphilus sp.]